MKWNMPYRDMACVLLVGITLEKAIKFRLMLLSTKVVSFLAISHVMFIFREI